MTDAEVETLAKEIAEDGIEGTNAGVRRAVEDLARLLMLISAPLPEPFASSLDEDQTLVQDALASQPD